MPESPLRLIKRCAEYQSKDLISTVPKYRRGVYVLYRRRRIKGKVTFAVVYVGMTTYSVRARLTSHRRKKGTLWSHFSFFEVWDNIRDEEIVELEGLFRHIYMKDANASALNVQRRFKQIRYVRKNDMTTWAT